MQGHSFVSPISPSRWRGTLPMPTRQLGVLKAFTNDHFKCDVIDSGPFNITDKRALLIQTESLRAYKNNVI